jgi:glycosyltransferase involved in cell wall biosynthesis
MAMRIALVSTVGTPVRPERSDSIEQHVWLLSRELTRLGHEVTVFATAGSEVAGELVASLPGPYGVNDSPADWHLCEWLNLCRAVEQSARFDVLHCHAYLWGLPLERLSAAPMVHTLHVTPYEEEDRLWGQVPGACVTAISGAQWAAFPHRRPTAVIHHAVAPDHFEFRPEPEDYVCYLGRFTEGKGPLQAIAAARAAGVRLVLAGPEDEYYRSRVAPHVDGVRVEYAGYVSGAARARLLGNARALLYPLQSPEPFGLVQVEAIMCGTPVVALRVGAVGEIIDEGITGYSTTAGDELAALVERAFALDRRRVRARAEARFSPGRMARAYADLYQRVVDRSQISVGGGERGGAWQR